MTVAQASKDGFAALVRKAVIWRSGSQIVGQLVSWIVTFQVLRILDPTDYGLYAMAAVCLSLLGLLNGSGLANALIQKAEVSRHEYRQLFGMLIVLNGTLAAIQFFGAPLVARFYGQPEVTNILRVLAIVLLTNPFQALAYAILLRDMDFRKQAQVNLATSILGAAVALGGALAGLGVWTLVLAPVSVFTVRAAAMMVAARAWMRPSFDFRGSGAMAGFGGAVALSSVCYFLQSQADVVIAGRMFDPHTVGLYTTALFLAQIFVNKVVPPLNEVAFTALARVHGDEARFAAGFLFSVRTIMLAAIPFCVGLAAVAGPVVAVALGDKWREIVPILQLLGCAMPWMVLQTLFAPSTNAAGRPGIALRNAALGAVIMPLVFLVGAHWGVTGLATAWLVGYPLITAITAASSLRTIGVSARSLFEAVAPVALAGIAMGMAVTAIDQHLPSVAAFPRLIALTVCGAAVYCGWLMLFARERIGEFVRMVRNR